MLLPAQWQCMISNVHWLHSELKHVMRHLCCLHPLGLKANSPSCDSCAADVLADIMKAEPEDTDTRMSDAGDENSFARANQGDSPDWTTRPLHVIQAAPHTEDSATHDISNDGPEEVPALFPDDPAQRDEAVSSPTSMFPATTADGAVFYMQDTSQAPRSGPTRSGPTRSDVSMATASHEDVSGDAANLGSRSAEPVEANAYGSHDIGAASNGQQHARGVAGGSAAAAGSIAEADAQASESGGDDKADSWVLPESLGQDVGDDDTVPDAASNEADDGGKSDIDDFQDISDEDLPKGDHFESDITFGYEKV